VIAVVVWQFLAALTFAASADGGTSVALDGDREVVSAMEHSLADRGIRVMSSAGPETVQVHVQPDPAGIRLFIFDRNGHAVERIVADPVIAAAVVESWMREDLARPLLEPHDIALPAGAPMVTRSPVPARPRPSSGASVTVAGETSLATDGSLWMGAALGACVRVGRVCVGLEIQAAGDTATTGNIWAFCSQATCGSSTPQQKELTRLSAGALATVDLPLRVGAGTLGPGIGLGASWLSTTAILDNHYGNATTVGLRAETRMLLSWPLAWGLAADVGLGADVLPFAHRKHNASDGFDLPDEPLGFLRAQLGLRYGPLRQMP
jgi:hypothetical protein